LEVEVLTKLGNISRSYSTKAAYIPTNDGHRISWAFAEKMGLQTDRDNGTTKACWKNKFGSKAYICEGSFTVTQDLPWDMVFGDYDNQGMLRGFPSPFEGAIKHSFDESFDFPKPSPSRTSSWKSFAEKRLPWAFVANSKRLSNTTKRPPTAPTTSKSATKKPTISHPLKRRAISDAGEDQNQRLDDDILERQITKSAKSSGPKSSASDTAKGQILLSDGISLLKAHRVHQAPNMLMTVAMSPDLDYNSTQRENCQTRQPESSNLIPVIYDTLEDGVEDLQVTSVSEHQIDLKIVDRHSGDSRNSSGTPEAISESPLKSSALRAESEQSHDLHETLSKEEINEMKRKAPMERLGVRQKLAKGQSYDLLEFSPPNTVVDEMQNVEHTDQAIEPSSNIETAILEVDAPRARSVTTGRLKGPSSVASRVSRESSVVPAAEPVARHGGIGAVAKHTISRVNMDGSLRLREAEGLPRNHGQITSYAVQRFIEQDIEDTPVVEQSTRSRAGSVQSSKRKPAKPKRVRNRHGLPRIRAVKSNTPDTSGNVNSAVMPASDDYWTWDDVAKQYFHIESDTGSTYWYEDTEFDSEEEHSSEARGTSPVISSSPPRNCEQADSGCLL
jgi:hypothetical protein